MKEMNYTEALEYMKKAAERGSVLGLSRVTELLHIMGDPQDRVRTVHISGTNGKGSFGAMLTAVLKSAGYKVGGFSSPAITSVTDSFRIGGEEISQQEFADLIGDIAPICESMEEKPTEFEVLTAAAFELFVRRDCEIAVVECGMGGDLDSTNVIPPPLVSVITSISLDHTALLGDTVEEIASHKAGIIKSGSAVILSEDNPDSVRELVRETAEKVGAELIPCEDCPPYGDGGLFSPFRYRGIKLTPAMAGIHQKYNAQTAITACIYLRSKGFSVSDSSIIRSVETTQVRGRVQYIDGEPPVLVDGGHNPAGVGMLSLMLMYLSTRGKKIYTVMGMVDSKDYVDCVKKISGLSDRFFAVDGFAPNAVSAETLADIASFRTEAEYGSLEECAEKAKALALENGGVAVICGSLYLASEYLNMK